MTTSKVQPQQRFTASHPCSVCGGHEGLPQGRGVRCYGFASGDGEWAYCTREEYAGRLTPGGGGTYAHRLRDDCNCGVRHDERPSPTPKPAPRRDARVVSRTVRKLPLADGRVAEHIRLDHADGGKEFVWQLDGKKGLGGIRVADLPLYGLASLDAGEADKTVVVVEGEQSADALKERGIPALATVTGASTIPGDESLKALVGRFPLLLWPDNDSEGRRHMARISERLAALGAGAVRVVEWPDAPLKGDAADFTSSDADLRALLNAARPAQAAEEEALPAIVVSDRQLREVTQEVVRALEVANDPPAVFVRSGSLARVRTDERGQPIIEALDDIRLRVRMARTADYERQVGRSLKGVAPPLDVVRDVLGLGEWPFPPLEGVVEAPAIRPDGSVIQRPGYDPATRLIYLPGPALSVPKVPESPSRDQLWGAIATLEEVIADFPFEDAASRANALALLLTPVLRPAISGPVPLALIDKPQPGTGASLLAEIVSIIATGRNAAMMTAPPDDEEWRKRITAALLLGAGVIIVDNVDALLSSASLSSALTAETWRDRVLQRSEITALPQRATWLATGNNIRLGGDMPRRCYWIRMDAQLARPWERKDFRHSDLKVWVAEHRGEVLAAALTLARAWYGAGSPAAETAWERPAPRETTARRECGTAHGAQRACLRLGRYRPGRGY